MKKSRSQYLVLRLKRILQSLLRYDFSFVLVEWFSAGVEYSQLTHEAQSFTSDDWPGKPEDQSQTITFFPSSFTYKRLACQFPALTLPKHWNGCTLLWNIYQPMLPSEVTINGGLRGRDIFQSAEHMWDDQASCKKPHLPQGLPRRSFLISAHHGQQPFETTISFTMPNALGKKACHGFHTAPLPFCLSRKAAGIDLTMLYSAEILIQMF